MASAFIHYGDLIHTIAYTRKASGHATGYVTSLFLLPFLGPFALVGTATATVAATNAGIKLDIINDEMRRRDKYKSTRARDVFGGAAISLATAGFRHGVSHVAHHAITHATHHVVTHGQHFICDGVGDASEHGAEYGIDKALEKDADLKMLSSVRYLCDMYYELIYERRWHCQQRLDFDYCNSCYDKRRNIHISALAQQRRESVSALARQRRERVY